MCSQEDFFDLKNEEYVVFYLFWTELSSFFPPAILEYWFTGDKLWLLSLGPLYLLSQRDSVPSLPL